VGPLRSAGITLPEIYAGAAVAAVCLGLLSLLIARGRPSPAAVHPRPSTHLRSLAKAKKIACRRCTP
jgi:hypothetical protein